MGYYSDEEQKSSKRYKQEKRKWNPQLMYESDNGLDSEKDQEKMDIESSEEIMMKRPTKNRAVASVKEHEGEMS